MRQEAPENAWTDNGAGPRIARTGSLYSIFYIDGRAAHGSDFVSSVGQSSPAAIWQMPPMPQATMLATAASV